MHCTRHRLQHSSPLDRPGAAHWAAGAVAVFWALRPRSDRGRAHGDRRWRRVRRSLSRWRVTG